MSFRFRPPNNEDDFEFFCVRFLRALWTCPTLSRYGKRGERQDGIDLIDESGSTPLRGVQCKHHESDKTIPPSEIEGEVTKANGAPFALEEYYILTTARKTTQGQNAVIRINREQQAKKAFKVIVWVWEDIEERLAQLDDATQERVIHGDSGRSGPAVCRMITGTLSEHFDRPLYASASQIDLELEAAKGLLDRHEVEVAEHKLAEIETRSVDRFQPHHHYQLKILRSRVYSSRWEWENAGREILAAVQHTPTTEKARINEALGQELLGDREKAHATADGLRAEFPYSVRLLTIWVRTAPPLITYSTLVEAAAPFGNDDEELCLALAHRTLADGLCAEGLRHATRATELDADSPQAWFILGQAKHSIGYQPDSGLLKGTLAEAEGHYTQALKLAKDQNLPGLQVAIRVNRAKVRHLLGLSGSDADFAAAIELNHRDDEPALDYVAFLLERDRYADALGILSGLTGEPGTVRLFYEAAARHGRNEGDDRTQATALLDRVIVSEPDERWVDAHTYLVQASTEANTQSAARQTITGSRLRTVNPVVFHTLYGWLAQSEGNPDDAKAAYRQALASLTDETALDQVFLLAQALAEVGEDEAALPLFERTYRRGVFNLECRRLIGCAQRLERHSVVCRVCRELREAGETDSRIVMAEIQILQQYDPNEALRVAVDYLAAHPGNRHVALWQSALALRLDRPDLLITDLARLPEAGEITPQGTCLVVGVLAEAGQHVAALRYAYQALRAHFGSEFVHGQFVWQFLRLSAHIPELRDGPAGGGRLLPRGTRRGGPLAGHRGRAGPGVGPARVRPGPRGQPGDDRPTSWRGGRVVRRHPAADGDHPRGVPQTHLPIPGLSEPVPGAVPRCDDDPTDQRRQSRRRVRLRPGDQGAGGAAARHRGTRPRIPLEPPPALRLRAHGRARRDRRLGTPDCRSRPRHPLLPGAD